MIHIQLNLKIIIIINNIRLQPNGAAGIGHMLKHRIKHIN